MKNQFYIRKGWLGTERNGVHFLYNVVDKEFVVFRSREKLEEVIVSRLKTIDTVPFPDFICEANAAAITLTTKCNMNCGYCYVQPAGGTGEMSPERAREAIRALGRQTDQQLVVFAWGGEPTQNPNALTEMLEEALDYPHIKVCLVTNGVMESALLKRLLQFKNLVFQISFDGLLNHDLQKPLQSESDSLHRMLRSMETISMVSRRVALRATVTADNVKELNDCLLPTAGRYTNRVMLEHLHTYNGRALALQDAAPSVEDYVDLVFNIVPAAEEKGIHVKVLPLDHLRDGGPNDKMTFLNVLPNGEIVVSNAIIHHGHEHFNRLHIGKLTNEKISFNSRQNSLLAERYLEHYQTQCQDCFARTVCRGSVQRYLFITSDTLSEWDNRRCKYFMGVLERWMGNITDSICNALDSGEIEEGIVRLVAPEGKIHYPMLVMKNGLSLKNRPL